MTEELILFIENKLNEHELMLSDLFAKIDEQDGYEKDDEAMQDYHEGAVEALSIVLHKAKELYNV